MLVADADERNTLGTDRDAAGMEMLTKADAVVSALASREEITASELAHIVDEPVSSVYRLLSSLSLAGWVSPGSRRGLYRLGMFFMRIGVLAEDHIDIREHSMPALRDLREFTGQTVYLCLRDDLRAVCIERLGGGDVRSMAMRLGATLPLVIGGAPKALLAFLPEEECQDVLDRTYQMSFIERIPDSRDIVTGMLEMIRLNGIALSDGDVTPGVSAIGAPVFNHRGELAAAVSVSGIHEHVLGETMRDRNIQAVRQCADAVSTSLGWLGKVMR